MWSTDSEIANLGDDTQSSHFSRSACASPGVLHGDLVLSGLV